MNFEEQNFSALNSDELEKLNSYQKRNYPDKCNFSFLSRITKGDPVIFQNYSYSEFYKRNPKQDVFKWLDSDGTILSLVIPTDCGIYLINRDIQKLIINN